MLSIVAYSGISDALSGAAQPLSETMDLAPANDLEFRYGTNAPTTRLEGMTVAGR